MTDPFDPTREAPQPPFGQAPQPPSSPETQPPAGSRPRGREARRADPARRLLAGSERRPAWADVAAETDAENVAPAHARPLVRAGVRCGQRAGLGRAPLPQRLGMPGRRGGALGVVVPASLSAAISDHSAPTASSTRPGRSTGRGDRHPGGPGHQTTQGASRSRSTELRDHPRRREGLAGDRDDLGDRRGPEPQRSVLQHPRVGRRLRGHLRLERLDRHQQARRRGRPDAHRQPRRRPHLRRQGLRDRHPDGPRHRQGRRDRPPDRPDRRLVHDEGRSAGDRHRQPAGDLHQLGHLGDHLGLRLRSRSRTAR